MQSSTAVDLLAYLSVWEKINNSDFSYPEFEVDILITPNSSLGSIFCFHSSSSRQLTCRKSVPSLTALSVIYSAIGKLSK